MELFVPADPTPPRRRRSAVQEEIWEAIQALAAGNGASVDGWRVVGLNTTKSVQTVRASLSKIRRRPDYPFQGWGKVRVYHAPDGSVCLAVRG